MQFCFSAGSTWYLFFGSLFFGAAAIAMIVMLHAKPDAESAVVARLVGASIMAAFSFLAFRSFLRFRDGVAVDNTGIWYRPKKGIPTYIAWAEVAAVETHESMQRLVVRDLSGARRIRLEYQLENFAQLREFVLSHVSDAATCNGTPPGVFRRSRINKLVSFLFGIGSTFLFRQGLHQQSTSLEVAGGVLAISLLVQIVLDPDSLVIGPDAILIRYPGWKRTIPISQITDVSMSDVTDGKGNVWAMVKIARAHGRPIKLFRFREGSIALYKAISTARLQKHQVDPQSA